jgi:hypothetical protein
MTKLTHLHPALLRCFHSMQPTMRPDKCPYANSTEGNGIACDRYANFSTTDQTQTMQRKATEHANVSTGVASYCQGNLQLALHRGHHLDERLRWR